MKMHWKLGDKPTGRYRSFSHRSWPMATVGNADGETLAALHPAVERVSYHASIAETTELIVRVADHRNEKWEWKQLKGRPVGVTAGKELAKRFFEANPDWLPKC